MSESQFIRAPKVKPKGASSDLLAVLIAVGALVLGGLGLWIVKRIGRESPAIAQAEPEKVKPAATAPAAPAPEPVREAPKPEPVAAPAPVMKAEPEPAPAPQPIARRPEPRPVARKPEPAPAARETLIVSLSKVFLERIAPGISDPRGERVDDAMLRKFTTHARESAERLVVIQERALAMARAKPEDRAPDFLAAAVRVVSLPDALNAAQWNLQVEDREIEYWLDAEVRVLEEKRKVEALLRAR